jgi:hypothetical protein
MPIKGVQINSATPLGAFLLDRKLISIKLVKNEVISFFQKNRKIIVSMNENAFQVFLADVQKEKEPDWKRLVKHMNLFLAG